AIAGDLAQGGLDATTIQRGGGQVGFFESALTVREEQCGVAVGLPETAQYLQGVLRQRDKAVSIAFGVSYLHPHPVSINIPCMQTNASTQPQPKAVQGEEKHAITERSRGREYLVSLWHGNHIRQCV